MLEAETEEVLKSVLAAIDTTVPPDPKQRTTKHLERYAAARLFAALPPGRLEFPLRLTHRDPPDDRPDFLLEMGARSVGVEHTRAIPQNQAHALSIRAAGNGPQTFFVQRARPGELPKRRQQLLEEMQTNDPGDGWVGDSPEREWAAAMADSVSTKLAGMSKPGFQRFQENWLLVFDEWPLPQVETEHAADILFASLQNGDALKAFNCIYVLNDHNLWVFSPSSRTVHNTVHNIVRE